MKIFILLVLSVLLFSGCGNSDVENKNIVKDDAVTRKDKVSRHPALRRMVEDVACDYSNDSVQAKMLTATVRTKKDGVFNRVKLVINSVNGVLSVFIDRGTGISMIQTSSYNLDANKVQIEGFGYVELSANGISLLLNMDGTYSAETLDQALQSSDRSTAGKQLFSVLCK